jgi:uncharacterized membrane protein
MAFKRIWNKFIVSFINGIVILLPVLVTVIIVRFLVLQLNKLVLNPFLKFLLPVTGDIRHAYIGKALVFFMVIFTVALVGWAARIIFINRLFTFGERIFIKVPIMGRIYNASKQIFSALIGQGKTVFKKVVMIEYPRKGIFSIGFITGDTRGTLRKSFSSDAVNIFVPTTPNPTSGMYIVVPAEKVTFLDMTVEEGMKLVISGGAVSPGSDIAEQFIRE